MQGENVPHHISLGQQGEEIAVRYMQQRGWKIIRRNFRSGHGEIDCVARDGDVLVFVEVKTRKNLRYGLPREAVTGYKRQVLRRTAQAYLLQHDCTEEICRFDVIEVIMGKNGESQITCWENAF